MNQTTRLDLQPVIEKASQQCSWGSHSLEKYVEHLMLMHHIAAISSYKESVVYLSYS